MATLDRGGRPSTACHAVFGDADTLTPRRCLALVGSAWSDQAVAETAAGGLPTLDGARLRATAAERLRKMFDELPVVKDPLTVVTAEWLRDPSRRLSLLAEEHDLPGWPRRNATPLLYLGLLSVFDDWFGTEWSYATYDTVDTHRLRLTCVPEWSSQAAGARSLARIRLRPPAEKDIETAAAKEMVAYVLDRPGAAPGVPHLTGELLSGARLPRQERREALRRMLNARHAPASAQAPAPQDKDRHVRQEDRYGQGERYGRENRQEDRYTSEHRQEDRYARQDREGRLEQERRRLQEELLVHQRVDTAQSARLAARLRDLHDDPLLTLLSADGLPWASRDLILAELADEGRQRSRDEATAHALCTEVLRHNLYFRPGRSGADGPSVPEMRERAAELFSWAVAPLVRDPHRAPDLRPLFNIVLKDGRGTGMEWLRRILVAPPGNRAPDLPPQLWQQVVTDLLAHPVSVTTPTPGPAPTPARAQVPAPAAATPAHVPAPCPRYPAGAPTGLVRHGVARRTAHTAGADPPGAPGTTTGIAASGPHRAGRGVPAARSPLPGLVRAHVRRDRRSGRHRHPPDDPSQLTADRWRGTVSRCSRSPCAAASAGSRNRSRRGPHAWSADRAVSKPITSEPEPMRAAAYRSPGYSASSTGRTASS